MLELNALTATEQEWPPKIIRYASINTAGWKKLPQMSIDLLSLAKLDVPSGTFSPNAHLTSYISIILPLR